MSTIIDILLDIGDWIITFPHFVYFPSDKNPVVARGMSVYFEIVVLIPLILLILRDSKKSREKAADMKRRGMRKSTLWERLVIKDIPKEVPLKPSKIRDPYEPYPPPRPLTATLKKKQKRK